MAKMGASKNTRSGGHAKAVKLKEISADPNGNREQRRAAKKLKVQKSRGDS